METVKLLMMVTCKRNGKHLAHRGGLFRCFLSKAGGLFVLARVVLRKTYVRKGIIREISSVFSRNIS